MLVILVNRHVCWFLDIGVTVYDSSSTWTNNKPMQQYRSLLWCLGTSSPTSGQSHIGLPMLMVFDLPRPAGIAWQSRKALSGKTLHNWWSCYSSTCTCPHRGRAWDRSPDHIHFVGVVTWGREFHAEQAMYSSLAGLTAISESSILGKVSSQGG